ncbi:MAG: DbpA RNA binding domain-containing protein, partial [Gemmatimonadota bacterium]
AAARPERGATPSRPRRPERAGLPSGELTRLFIAAGRNAKVRPADLVGAIANEAGLHAKAIGSIEIADAFSIVEVPSEAADDVIAALRSATIRGRRVLVRRDRG